ncbi:MAG: urea transporter [Candidatus Eisenbacteria bacterium]|nr:urea transporter [Candidatus Eisenbacteria bacterium]
MTPADHRAPEADTPLRLTATGLAGDGTDPPRRLLAFVDSVLRGIGQVMLQNNAFTGLLFLAGLFFNSALFGWAALLGAAVSTAAATLLGAARSQIREGLFGFNGALVAIALLFFLKPDALAWSYVVLAAACTTVLMAALIRLFGTWKVPALTAPFVLTTLGFVLATARFGRLHSTGVLPTAGLPTAASVEGVVTAATVGTGLLTGLSQVFFQGNAITGVLFAVGLFLSSRSAGVAALLGSLAGLLTAWVLGAAEPAIRSGAFGFNSVLAAIALAGGFGPASTSYAALGAIASAVLFAALSAALAPLGMPALTSPFVLVVWLFLLARPLLRRVQEGAAA